MARFMMASNPQLSPDASRLAYVVTRIEGDDYDTTIMIVDASDGSLLKFLSGKKDRSPRWSPDGKRLLFLSDRGMEEGEKGTGVWLLPIVSGEPKKVAHMEGGVEQPRWGADGGRVYFISSVGEEDSEVKVVDSVPIWFNGAGFVHHRRKHLHVLEIESGEVEQLTEGDRSVVCIAPSRYGGKVAYAMEARGLSPGSTSSRSTTSTRGGMMRWSPASASTQSAGPLTRTRSSSWAMTGGTGTPPMSASGW